MRRSNLVSRKTIIFVKVPSMKKDTRARFFKKRLLFFQKTSAIFSKKKNKLKLLAERSEQSGKFLGCIFAISPNLDLSLIVPNEHPPPPVDTVLRLPTIYNSLVWTSLPDHPSVAEGRLPWATWIRELPAALAGSRRRRARHTRHQVPNTKVSAPRLFDVGGEGLW